MKKTKSKIMQEFWEESHIANNKTRMDMFMVLKKDRDDQNKNSSNIHEKNIFFGDSATNSTQVKESEV